ncbi:SMP-30/gluconolactonase/LRE family protein [Acuticoccus sp. I52.16.1]|uniref:SMP-30/gluconolactonase/LRE family protein n=1 Tax=Acuticoccus sp. I52.16.1 TaxID=2928472 RepID=UPI001FD43304|nr:SMP-30/gluconolactonase/LRE family protein [Acuticoccus sp. I52.16.1]UOM35225.1 SMP-30/gluconolactonase/LRE family protein [Acuticoccus sp. I52.16.1]
MSRVNLVHDAGAAIGEGAFWDPASGLLFWCDIDKGIVHRYDPRSGPKDPIAVGERVGCLAPRRDGDLVIATQSGLYDLDLATGGKTMFAEPEAHLPDNRFNDGATDRQGRWWAGTMSIAQPPTPVGTFYRIDADRRVTPMIDGIYTTNGLAFSPDGRTMYFSDSNPLVRTIWAADYDIDDGVPTARRVFFDTRSVAGRPDGATVDAAGCYWMAGVGGWQILRITPAGKVDMIVDMPVERPSKPEFGGPGLTDLYVTSIGSGAGPVGPEQPHAGGLFVVTGLPAAGLAPTPFAG